MDDAKELAVLELERLIRDEFDGDKSKVTGAGLVKWYDRWRAELGEIGVQDVIDDVLKEE